MAIWLNHDVINNRLALLDENHWDLDELDRKHDKRPQIMNAPQHSPLKPHPSSASTLDPRPSIPSTVFLIDDDASVRKALTRLIRSAGYDVQAFASAHDFLDNFRVREENGPACLVLDVRMPGLSGLDLQQKLQATNTVLPIIFITGHGDIPMSVRAMKDGAVDFLPKPVKDKELLKAVEQALARANHDHIERLQLEDIQRRVDSLTPREREVMSLVVRGFLNKQIAFELGTVEKTIKVHRARVMEKMEVQSFAELVRIAERVGFGKT
jgi:FixJ family two-component response regulator